MFFKYKSEKETKVEVSHGGEGFYILCLKDVKPVRCTFPSGGNQSCWTGSSGLGRPRGGCLLGTKGGLPERLSPGERSVPA